MSIQHAKNNSFAILLFLIVITSSLVLGILPQSVLILIGVLVLGLPVAMLVISRQTRNKAVVLMLVLLPLTSILKAISGSRFAPLTFDLGLLLAALLYIGEGLLYGRLRLGKLDLPLLLLWGVAIVEVFNPNVPSLQAGIEGFRKFIFMSVTYYIGRHILQIRDFFLFRKWMILFSIPVTLYGIKQFFFMGSLDYRMIELSTSSSVTFLMGGWIRPFSTMSGPFHLGLYLMITLILIIALLKSKQTQPSHRTLLVLLAFLQFILLLMTRTKGNWVGFIVGALVLLVLQSHNYVRMIIRLSGFTLLGGVLLFGLFTLTSGRGLIVLEDALFAITHPLQAPTLIYRIGLWQETIIPALKIHPFIGYGTSSAGEGLVNLYKDTDAQFFSTHNLYIKVWIELGLFGSIIFLWLIVKNLLDGARHMMMQRFQYDPETKILLQWALAVVVAFLISGLVIPTLDAYPPNYYFWLLLGLLSRAEKLEKQN